MNLQRAISSIRLGVFRGKHGLFCVCARVRASCSSECSGMRPWRVLCKTLMFIWTMMILFKILKFHHISCKIQRELAMVREVRMTLHLIITWHNKSMEQEVDIDSLLPTFISIIVKN
jgi:small-conductance mechanosensitive channel